MTTDGDRLMIPLRSTAAAGLLALFLAPPAVAQGIPTQSAGPADSGAQRDRPALRTEPAPPMAKEMRPRGQPQVEPPARVEVEPPARAEDDFAQPPPAGCRYRDNKLDLLV
jgi:hypothetical protein